MGGGTLQIAATGQMAGGTVQGVACGSVEKCFRRNARKEEATEPSSRPSPKSYRKCWDKEEIDLMLQPKVQFHGDPRITKCMTKFLPEKTGKQIRDKRKELSYKTLLAKHIACKDVSIGQSQDTSIAGNDDQPMSQPSVSDPHNLE
jgi:hypothetical protein